VSMSTLLQRAYSLKQVGRSLGVADGTTENLVGRSRRSLPRHGTYVHIAAGVTVSHGDGRQCLRLPVEASGTGRVDRVPAQ
jgi:hypothetical protein